VGVGLVLLMTPGIIWPPGRRVSSIMAESRMTPAEQAAVRSLLDPGESLADASVWADV
jgi:hypothetical protein